MSEKEEIREVRKAHRFNEAVLVDYLREHLDGFSGSLNVRQFGYGQSNPTYLLTDTETGRGYVLRKKPPGKLLPSAHAVDREYKIIKALGKTDVPVPEVYLLCQEESIVGTPFYVMAHVKGRIFRQPTIPEARDAAERGAILDAMNDTLVRIHAVDLDAAGLADFGKPGNYMARQTGRWTKQYLASQTDDIQSMDRLMAWLADNVPDDDTTSIVHGDFRLENMIVHPVEPRIIAVLDWELSTLGHPLADLAYNCMGYHLPADDNVKFGYMGIDFQATGIPTEDDYVKAYCRRTGRQEIPDWTFYIAFSLFRIAAIVQGVYKRGLDGNASASDAQTYGEQVRGLADVAWDLVQKNSND
ncbi:MAG: phosphotransferase [Deltaproteobacteria bacterium]|nr:phosphotransferase [Deltaproteobacteria bacterium]MBW2177249.1 phosphotransferase [Deltaproteobacteria bacterium]